MARVGLGLLKQSKKTRFVQALLRSSRSGCFTRIYNTSQQNDTLSSKHTLQSTQMHALSVKENPQDCVRDHIVDPE